MVLCWSECLKQNMYILGYVIMQVQNVLRILEKACSGGQCAVSEKVYSGGQCAISEKACSGGQCAVSTGDG